VPSFARDSVKNYLVSGSNRRAGARVLSGVFSYHFGLHGFPFKYIGNPDSAAIRRLCPIVRVV